MQTDRSEHLKKNKYGLITGRSRKRLHQETANVGKKRGETSENFILQGSKTGKYIEPYTLCNPNGLNYGKTKS